MKHKHVIAHMKAAYIYAECSTAARKKVGALIVKNDRILSVGYNGLPSGWDNVCEDELPDGTLVTKPEVIHAESNAIVKVAKDSGGSDGASLIVTLSPCLQCAKLIYQAGIKEVFYSEEYRDSAGLQFLINCGIKVEKIDV